jgi:hypothetical protein
LRSCSSDNTPFASLFSADRILKADMIPRNRKEACSLISCMPNVSSGTGHISTNDSATALFGSECYAQREDERGTVAALHTFGSYFIGYLVSGDACTNTARHVLNPSSNDVRSGCDATEC